MANLIQFSVENFRSIKDRATLSMVAVPRLVSKDTTLDTANLFEIANDLSLVKTAAIYGANASGKSNLVGAMRLMRQMVMGSSKDTAADQKIGVEPFRLAGSDKKASTFEVVFHTGKTVIRYGFSVNQNEVLSEWLFQRPRNRDVKLFVRYGDRFELGRSFAKEGKGLVERTRKNALFLSVVAQFNGAFAGSVQKWFSSSFRIISGLDDAGYRQFTIGQCEKSDWKQSILEFVQKMDVGIEDLSVGTTPLGERLPPDMPPSMREFLLAEQKEISSVSTLHTKFDKHGNPTGTVTFDIDEHESEGTKKIFALAGPVVDTLTNGWTLVVDELDARLHPLITAALIKMFNSRSANPKNAQLVFTTHDTNLLRTELLRRDQIWFVEKDRFGGSQLYALVEYKPRNDSPLAKNYIEGRYGAIPFVGDVTSLLAPIAEK